MRKTLLAFIACCLCAMIGLQKAAATNFKGGEISYVWYSDSTYTFYLKLYGPCTGLTGTLPLTSSICYYNSCDNQSGTISLTYLNVPPTSQPPAPAYTEYWYSGRVTLPSRCDSWTFYTSIDNRDNSVNIQNATQNNLYLEATINNQDIQDASAPVFMEVPMPYAYIGHPYYYLFALMDPNNDHFEIEMVQPRTAAANFNNANACAGSYAATNINYSAAKLNPTNPLECQNTFTFNQVGTFGFTPDTAAVGGNTIAVRVNKYRNSEKLGSIMRETIINVVSMPHTPQVAIELDTNNITGATIDGFGRINATTYTPFTFCYTASQPGDQLTVRDNHAFAMPNSTATYTGQNSSYAQACFSWTPTWTDTGMKVITLSIADTTVINCAVIKPQVTDQYAIQIPVHVSAPTGIIPVCYSDQISIHPNPAVSAVTINAPNPVNVVICSLDGKMILNIEQAKTIDISALAKGIYLMRVSDENGQLIKVEKLVKM